MREPHNNPATAAVNRSRKRLTEYLQRIVQRGSSSIFLGLVLLVEVGVGLVVIRDLHHSYLEVERIYGGSVRGLQRIGELQYDAQETRRGTLYALTTNDGNLQVKYADQSHDADHRVTVGIVDYLAQAQTSEEIRVGQGLSDDWKAYLETRDEVLGLILESSIKEAIDLDLALGVTRFERVHQDLEEIKRLYDQQASQRLDAVAGFSRGSTIKLTAALGFGVLFGSIAIWKIQQIRMRNALQLARLQMDFVTSVSHELRTPITAILSAAENVRDGLVREAEELREQGTIITTHAVQLTDLVGQVLLYAATEKDKPWHQVRPLKVAEVVESALGDVAFLLKQNGSTVQQEVEAGLPMVDGDVSVISQCLQNLIVNAVKYSGQSRLIHLSARLAPSANKASEVQISVRDFGIGIGDADLPHVFEPFYRSSRAVAARIRGTGLGLSIAKRGAEASGGRLTVVSKEGLGSVFTLHLPASLEVELEFEVEKARLRRVNHAREHSNH
jgi:signal transduction histidine kinase